MLTLAFSICGLLPHPVDPLRDLLSRATGKNGYEDYVRAAISLRDAHAVDLCQYAVGLADRRSRTGPMPALGRSGGRGGGRAGERTMVPPGVPPSATPDQVMSLALSAAGPALAWVAKGNVKPVENLRPRITSATTYPEVHPLRLLSQLLALRASRAFAAGDHKMGIAAAKQALLLTQKMPVGGLEAFGTFVRAEHWVFTRLASRFDMLDLSDVNELQSRVQASLKEPSALSAVARLEQRRYWDDWGYLLDHPDGPLAQGTVRGPAREAIIKTTRGFSPSERKMLFARYIEGLAAPWAVLAKRLAGPEPGWTAPIAEDDPKRRIFLRYLSEADRKKLYSSTEYLSDQPGESAAAARGSATGTDSVAAHAFILLTLMMYQQMGEGTSIENWQRAAVESRIRRRLFLEAMAILRFRLRHGRLPASLQEIDGHTPLDPYSLKPYRYRTLGGGAFAVSCPTGTIGEVKLD